MKKKLYLAILLLIIMLLTFSAIGLADAPVPLGGLYIEEYCIAHGFTGYALLKPIEGPNAAFNNWRCTTADGKLRPFSMVQACQWEYGMNAVQAHPTDKDNAYTWVCYSVKHSK